MLISFISNNEFAYVNLHAEQSYRDFQYLNLNDTDFNEDIRKNSEMGIYCKDLKVGVIKELINNIGYIGEQSKINHFGSIILNFDNIKKIQPNMVENLRSFFKRILELEINILMINMDVCLLPDVQSFSKDFKDEIYRDDKNEYICTLKCNENEIDYIEKFKMKKYMLETIDKIFNEAFNKALGSCCEDNSKPLYSTPVYTSKYINIKKCMEDIHFFPYAVYKLAKKLISEKVITADLKENSKISLFCHTLNGAYIASLLSNLLCIDLVFFDHIGPANRIYKTFLNNQIDKNKSYIIVADVICLGSELRAVKTLLDYSGSKCIGSVSIINCKTVNDINWEEKRYSILELSKDYNPIGYYIRTNLTEEIVN